MTAISSAPTGLIGRRAETEQIAAQLFLSPRTAEWHLRKVS